MGVVLDAAAEAGTIRGNERIMRILDTAAGSGNMQKNHRRAHMRDLRRQARGPSRHTEPKEITRRDAEDGAAELAQAGIRVNMVPKVLGAVPRASDG